MKIRMTIELQIPPDCAERLLTRMECWQKADNELEDYEEIELWLKELERAGATVKEYGFDCGKEMRL